MTPPRIEDRLQQRVFDNLTTAVMLLNDRLEVHCINPAAEMLFAVSAHKAEHQSLQHFVLGPASLVEHIQQASDKGHPFTEREVELELSGGRSCTVDCTVTPLDEPDLPSGVLVEIVQVDRQLRISREENLLAQHTAATAVVRGLAHEIKNPLGGLRGAAQLLERELPDDGLKEYTRIIIEEADRLQTLVNRMLGPRQLPNKASVNIHDLLERVRSLVMVEAPATVSLRRDYDPSIPSFEADADQLIQAILNLVRNALQAVGERGEIVLRTRTQRQITIGPKRHRLVLSVEVIDNGPGVPADIQERIFYPMITAHANGTGLGLTIAQSLVGRHHGLIECSSTPGNTVFRILLPLEMSHDS